MFARLPLYALWLGVAMFAAGGAGAQQTDDFAASTDWLRGLAEGGTTEGQVILLDQATQGSLEAQYAVAIICIAAAPA